MKTNENKKTPRHVAIICDGNRRWARKRGLKVFAGHQKAITQNFEELIDAALDLHIEYITFWIFSTENWDRDPVEVQYLMNLFRQMFDEKINTWNEKNIRFKMIGNIEGFEEDIQERILVGQQKTAKNNAITVTLAMNYGGRDELLRATQKITQKVVEGALNPLEITQQTIADHLDTAGMPDPDVIIRTSGEQRLSGFFSWQQQYAEFVFAPYTFPDMHKKQLEEAIEDFLGRERRYGKG